LFIAPAQRRSGTILLESYSDLSKKGLDDRVRESNFASLLYILLEIKSPVEKRGFFSYWGVGKMNFCPPAYRAEGAVRVGSGSSLRQQGNKARKISFLNRKRFFAPPLKENEKKFCGLWPPSGGELLGWGYRERSERQSSVFQEFLIK